MEHKETKKMVRSVFNFYQAVKDSNYQGYLDCLSPTTLVEIRPEKLERKYKKFQRYAVNFKGKLAIRSVLKYNKDCFEETPVYVCIIKLPEGDKILKRVGFDPLKKATFNRVENHIGLHLVLTESDYKVVIPW